MTASLQTILSDRGVVMSNRSTLICGLILSPSMFGVALSQNGQPTTSTVMVSASLPGKTSESFSGKALYITLKNSSQGGVAVEDPEFRTLGDRTFLVGHSPAVPANVLRKFWVPVAEIWTIEEFVDNKEMARVYRIESADAK
jgi:hypothetical protein